MSPHVTYPERPSRIWISFSSITFGTSLMLLGGGIIALPLDWTLRGWLMMGLVIMVGSSFMLAGGALRPAGSHPIAQLMPSARRHSHHR
jgi:hypothetical protein